MGKFISNYNELPIPNKRIYDLVQSKSDGNVKAFAEMIGVKQQILDRIFKKDPRNGKYPSISEKIKEGLENTFGLDDIWLLTGEGKMANDNTPKTELLQISEEDNEGDFFVENSNGAKFYSLNNGKYRMSVKLVPFCAYGRFANETDTLEPDKEDWEEESFEVSNIVHGNYLSFEIKGESMDDGTRESFEAGDRVLVRELSKTHWTDRLRYNDYPYWVVVFDSSVLIKQIIKQDIENGIITFHSLNPSPEYCDFQLSLDEIRKLYYVIQKKPKTVNF